MDRQNPTEEQQNWEVYTPEQSSARLASYLDVFWRRKWFLMAVVFGGTVLVAAYTFFMPYTYVAEAKLMPPEERSSGQQSFASLLATGGIDLGGLGSSQSAMIFTEILNSRTLADSLITRLDLIERLNLPEKRQLAVQAVKEALYVDDAKSGVVTVQFSAETSRMPSDAEIDSVAQLSAEVVNEAIDLLDILNREKIVTRASRSRDFLKRMTEVKRAALDSAREKLAEFQAENRAFAIDQQLESAVGALAQVQTVIQLKELELAAAQRELNPSSEIIGSLNTELAELRRQQSQLTGTDVLGMDLGSTPELLKEYTGLRLDLEVAAQVYTYLESQYHSEQVQAARDLPTVSVLDNAEPPTLRSSPRRSFIVIIAFVVFMVLGLGLVVVLELFGSEFRDFTATRFSRKSGRN